MNVPPLWTDAFVPRPCCEGFATATAPIIRWGWTVPPVASGTTAAVSPRSWQWSPRQNSRNLVAKTERDAVEVILTGITMVKTQQNIGIEWLPISMSISPYYIHNTWLILSFIRILITTLNNMVDGCMVLNINDPFALKLAEGAEAASTKIMVA